jgi:hypothetical protein
MHDLHALRLTPPFMPHSAQQMIVVIVLAPLVLTDTPMFLLLSLGVVPRQKYGALANPSFAPSFFISFALMTMFVVKRDGKRQSCQFDKIQSRISKLCYGLDQKVSAACSSMAVVWRRQWGYMCFFGCIDFGGRMVHLPSSIRPYRSYACVK